MNSCISFIFDKKEFFGEGSLFTVPISEIGPKLSVRKLCLRATTRIATPLAPTIIATIKRKPRNFRAPKIKTVINKRLIGQLIKPKSAAPNQIAPPK